MSKLYTIPLLCEQLRSYTAYIGSINPSMYMYFLTDGLSVTPDCLIQ